MAYRLVALSSVTVTMRAVGRVSGCGLSMEVFSAFHSPAICVCRFRVLICCEIFAFFFGSSGFGFVGIGEPVGWCE